MKLNPQTWATEYDDDSCPKCGNFVNQRRCWVVGCDGGRIDLHEFDDPLLHNPGETEQCDECNGHGRHEWCSVCGWDLLEKRYVNQRAEAAAQPTSDEREEVGSDG